MSRQPNFGCGSGSGAGSGSGSGTGSGRGSDSGTVAALGMPERQEEVFFQIVEGELPAWVHPERL